MTWRAVLLGLLVVPPNAYWVVRMELFGHSTLGQGAFPTTVSLFFNAVFTLLLLQMVTLLLRRVAPRVAPNQAELLLVFSMVSLGTAMASVDFVQMLVPVFSWSFYMASPENQWATLINEHLPTWLTVQDPHVYRPFFEAGSTLHRPDFLSAWAVPVLAWTGFIMALVAVMAGLSVLVRRQWLEHEHLACPLVRLPVEISNPRVALLRNRLFWVGFALAGGMDLYNSLAFHFPGVPLIPLEPHNLALYLRGHPWTALDVLHRSVYPLAIGLGYLMPTDFLFSCWFFHLFWKALLVLSAALGLGAIPDFPYTNFQSLGAYLLFAVTTLWVGRSYARRVGLRVLGLPGGLNDHREPLRYRTAALLVVGGFTVLLWFSSALGLRLWLAVVFFAMYYVLALAITRMRAQFGAPIHDLHFTGPEQVLTAAIGTAQMDRRELVTLGVYYWFNRAYRGHAMPHKLEGLRMQDAVAGTSYGVIPALLAAALAGVLSGLWSILYLNYQLGAVAKGALGGTEFAPRMASWLAAPQGMQPGPLLAIGVGFVFAFCLEAMRFRYINWPFHPLGYAISASWQMNRVWMPLMIAWVLKTSLLRFGGHRVYQRMIPAFLGLVMGQFVVGSLVNIVSIILNIPSYRFWT